jgi:hypothetical protein
VPRWGCALAGISTALLGLAPLAAAVFGVGLFFSADMTPNAPREHPVSPA